MSEIGVVHLVRARNGIEPFNRFLTSYMQNPGGLSHDLLIVFKGFTGRKSLSPYKELLIGIPHESLFIADFGFDIRAYFKAARTFRQRYFCFLNSFSEIIDRNWLVKFYEHISRIDVGLVGATGSYESAFTNGFLQMDKDAQVLRRLANTAWVKMLRAYFDPFPNYHIRTNGFMMARDTMLKIRTDFIVTKMGAHRFESGRDSLTKQVLHMNLKALIVGKDGRGFDKEVWPQSLTFRLGSQDNLLISDNQTKAYLASNQEARKRLARYSWGDFAVF